ncbi:MAG: flagellar filament capping protein FliD [Phycisphaerales bacterium]|nr:flagellar filament capping protein FliD [Phycisphaerales bacterium]
MGGITTGTGLFSGIDSAGLISQLMAIEARPKLLVQSRIVELQREQAAYLDINSALLALSTAASAFDTLDIFKSAAATSSNPDVLTASAGTTASPGSYNMFVHRLVSTQQSLSRGFADKDTTAVGATSFTFEGGGGRLDSETKLSELNGGEGISRGEFRVTDRSGASAMIDISAAVTVNDVLDAINSASGIDVTASVRDGAIMLEDSSGGGGMLAVTDVYGSRVAKDLGIEKQILFGGGALIGDQLHFISENTALSALNDGNGINIRDDASDLVITDLNGTQVGIDLGRITHTEQDAEGEDITVVDQNKAVTVGDLLTIANDKLAASGSTARLRINDDRTGFVVEDSSGGGGEIIVSNGASNRTTATDLGIQTAGNGAGVGTLSGRRVLSEINSSLTSNLLGGKGLTQTKFNITDRNGTLAAIEVDADVLDGSVSELIANINEKIAAAAPTSTVTARLNSAGNGIEFVDAGSGTGNLIITGGAADELGLATDPAGVARSTHTANLQSKWLSRSTRLDSLNAGNGIGTGSFRITTADGHSDVVNISSDIKTIDDLLVHLNSRPGQYTARVNGNGDGIEIVDDTGASGTLKIEDVSGSVARKLNIAGEAQDVGGSIAINGSFEKTVTFAAGATLEDVRDAINEANVGVAATIVNDGGGVSPYRLSLAADDSGSAGRIIIDSGNFNLGLTSLSRGEDAIVFFGSSDPANAITLTSSTNTLDDVIQGVTIDLKGTSDEAVELNVSRDNAAIEEAIEKFVTAFNSVLSKIEQYDKYDAEKEVRGVLLGDSTVNNIKRALYRVVQGEAEGVDGPYQRLFQVGVRIGDGAKLEFDSDRFRDALENNFENVEALFAANKLESTGGQEEIFPGVFVQVNEDVYSQLGVAQQINQLVKSFTNSIDGTLTVKGKTLDSQIQLSQDRIGQLDTKLDAKRARLELQFLQMEQAIASLQTQSQALSGLGAF